MRRRYFQAFGIPAATALLLMMFSAGRILANFAGGFFGTIESIPIDRLIRNLEEFAAKDPKNAASRLNLARVHSMAYALKSAPTDEVQIQTLPGQPPALFSDPSDKAVPFQIKPTVDSALGKAAAEHLAKAIDLYRQGLELDQSNLVAKLGYGWCLEQLGDRSKAITAYRQVVLEAWTREARVDQSGRIASGVSPLGTSITSEAAGYLIPLLDRDRDRDEVATLQERIRVLGVGPRGITPIVIPLSNETDASKLINANARVSFDADGSGARKPWTWITPSAGWLVHAPARVRTIDSAMQMFGSVTFWLFWENGYDALRSLDDNGNGALEGKELADLAIWRDANSNGLTDEGELKPLADWGIVSVNCAYENTRGRKDYVAFSAKGVTFKDGRTHPTYDVILYTQRATE
jgi:tetratricopeptide (TPR) repeat protein